MNKYFTNYEWGVNEMIELASGIPAPQFGDESSWVRGSELVQGSSGSCVSFWLMNDKRITERGVLWTSRSDGSRLHDIHTAFHKGRGRHSGNSTVTASKFWGYNVGITDGGYLKYAVRMASDSIRIGSDIQEILRLQPGHFETLQCWYYRFRGDLWSMPLGWPQVAWYTYQAP
jgi:hypothetical protein